MRVRRIDVEGTRRGHRAELTRDGANVIANIYIEGDLAGCHIVGHSQTENLRELARQLQSTLDGHSVAPQAAADGYHHFLRQLAQ